MRYKEIVVTRDTWLHAKVFQKPLPKGSQILMYPQQNPSWEDEDYFGKRIAGLIVSHLPFEQIEDVTYRIPARGNNDEN